MGGKIKSQGKSADAVAEPETTVDTEPETTVDTEPETTVDTKPAVETKPQPASYSFDFFILDECNQIATVKTVMSSKSSEAEAIADASAQLGDLNWRYTGNFKRL